MSLLTIITGLAMLASLAWWLAVPRYRSSAPMGIAMVGCAIAWLACSHWLPYWAVWVGVVMVYAGGGTVVYQEFTKPNRPRRQWPWRRRAA